MGLLDYLRSTFWPNPAAAARTPANPWDPGNPAWAPGAQPNPWAVPSDPSADGSSSDPYHDGQWSPLIAPVLTNPEADQVRADAYVPPYTGPLDLDDYGRETDEMRRAYRDLHRSEPSLRSAIDGKAAAVAALDVSVLPEDERSPEDVRASEFVDWTVSRSPHGWDGLILTLLRAALIDGFSLAEKVLRGVDESPKWHGFWGLKHVKGRDTAHLMLRLDGYRNVLGVVNTVRGLRTYSPGKFILFTHAELFDNPFGQSDLRACYRAANQIRDAYQLWYLALKRCGEPYLHGKYDHPAQRTEFEKALRSLRAGGWAVTGPKDEIAVLDLAGAASFDAFEKKVRLLREDIFLAVRGAYTPFMQSNTGGGEATGSAAVSQNTGSDPVEELLARAVGRVLTAQLVPDLVRPNFGPGVGLPRVVLGGVNWGEMKQRLDVVTAAVKAGLRPSRKWALQGTEIKAADPNDPDDQLTLDEGGQPAPAGGRTPGITQPAPAGTLAGGPGAPQPAPAAAPAAPATPFSAEHAEQFASHFAADPHGRYPGDLHEKYGLDPTEFARRTGLRLRQFSRRGEPVLTWVLPKPQGVPAATQPAAPPLVGPDTFSAGHQADPDLEALLSRLEGRSC